MTPKGSLILRSLPAAAPCAAAPCSPPGRHRTPWPPGGGWSGGHGLGGAVAIHGSGMHTKWGTRAELPRTGGGTQGTNASLLTPQPTYALVKRSMRHAQNAPGHWLERRPAGGGDAAKRWLTLLYAQATRLGVSEHLVGLDVCAGCALTCDLMLCVLGGATQQRGPRGAAQHLGVSISGGKQLGALLLRCERATRVRDLCLPQGCFGATSYQLPATSYQ